MLFTRRTGRLMILDNRHLEVFKVIAEDVTLGDSFALAAKADLSRTEDLPSGGVVVFVAEDVGGQMFYCDDLVGDDAPDAVFYLPDEACESLGSDMMCVDEAGRLAEWYPVE